MLLSCFGVNTIRKCYHNEDPKYDFVKAKKGELMVADSVSGGDLIISTQVSFADYLILEVFYSPQFTKINKF